MSNPILFLIACGLLIMMLGVYMLFMYRNLLRLIIGVELVAKGITLLFLGAGVFRRDIGFIQSLIVTFIIVETVLAAIMLALVIRAHKIYGSLDIRLLSKLRG
jgi:multisubunit Na+/H+ antiporter MnhC subunit